MTGKSKQKAKATPTTGKSKTPMKDLVVYPIENPDSPLKAVVIPNKESDRRLDDFFMLLEEFRRLLKKRFGGTDEDMVAIQNFMEMLNANAEPGVLLKVIRALKLGLNFDKQNPKRTEKESMLAVEAWKLGLRIEQKPQNAEFAQRQDTKSNQKLDGLEKQIEELLTSIPELFGRIDQLESSIPKHAETGMERFTKKRNRKNPDNRRLKDAEKKRMKRAVEVMGEIYKKGGTIENAAKQAREKVYGRVNDAPTWQTIKWHYYDRGK